MTTVHDLGSRTISTLRPRDECQRLNNQQQQCPVETSLAKSETSLTKENRGHLVGPFPRPEMRSGAQERYTDELAAR